MIIIIITIMNQLYFCSQKVYVLIKQNTFMLFLTDPFGCLFFTKKAIFITSCFCFASFRAPHPPASDCCLLALPFPSALNPPSCPLPALPPSHPSSLLLPPLSFLPTPSLWPPTHSLHIFFFLARQHGLLIVGVLAVLVRVKCHEVPFSICLFHATLHQPLTCGSHVVQEGSRFIQSKEGWKLTPIYPFQEGSCGKWEFHDRSVESGFF